MTFIEAIGSGYSNWFNVSGRACRSEFWWFNLFTLLMVVAIIIMVASYVPIDKFTIILRPIFKYSVLLFITPLVSLSVRRLHDVGFSGWWTIIAFTGIGILVLMFWYFKKGDEGSNRFGNNPLESVSQSEPSIIVKPDTQTYEQGADKPTQAYSNDEPKLDPKTRVQVEDASTQRLNEEKLYEQVASEMDSDDIRIGLWAKATAHAEGDDGKTKAFYIKYRVQALQNELEERTIIEKEKQEQDRLDNLKSVKEEKEAEEAANTLRIAEEHFNKGVVQKTKGEFYNAAKEFKKSAQLGHSIAQCELGLLLLDNWNGVRKSYKDACKWFSLSAEQGNSIAKYNLGLIYKNGLGVGVDLAKAFVWFEEAATMDHQLAMEEVSKLLAEDKSNYLTKELIEQLVDNEVRFDGVNFNYTGYAYDNLEAALTYAKSCNS